ncbi:hypothetical protein K501DRAFT_273509 [Backusella circina FSU 941]|nr:hypothetical protein K501DRAFT_273509 [Backusella circina FSU 941]
MFSYHAFAGKEIPVYIPKYPNLEYLVAKKKGGISEKPHCGEITSAVTKDTREYIKKVVINEIKLVVQVDYNKEYLSYTTKVFNVDSTTTTFGRKLDVMVVGNESKVLLCAIEWKKQNVDKTKLLLQQAKNIRVNKCHLSHILKMNFTESEKKQTIVTGMDWRGLNGYMFGVKKVDNIYSSVLIGTLMIPTHLKLVEEFEDTLVLLLRWRSHLIKLAEQINLSQLREQLNSNFEGIIATGLKRQASATNITYMSPKRRCDINEVYRTIKEKDKKKSEGIMRKGFSIPISNAGSLTLYLKKPRILSVMPKVLRQNQCAREAKTLVMPTTM